MVIKTVNMNKSLGFIGLNTIDVILKVQDIKLTVIKPIINDLNQFIKVFAIDRGAAERLMWFQVLMSLNPRLMIL
jgi:hypothetical protein